MVFIDEVTRSDARGEITCFARLITRVVATNAVRTRKARCAILNLVALFPFGARWTSVAAAIDVGLIAILLAVRARETQIRFAVADFSLGCAIGVGIAFDALALAVTRIASTRVAGRSLRRRRFDLHAPRTRCHKTIVGRRIIGDIDGFFATSAVTLQFFAIAGDLRL